MDKIFAFTKKCSHMKGITFILANKIVVVHVSYHEKTKYTACENLGLYSNLWKLMESNLH